MRHAKHITRWICVAAMASCAVVTAYAGPPAIDDITLVPRLTIESDLTNANEIQYITNLEQTNWTLLTNLVVAASPYWFVDAGAPPSPQRFYRVASSLVPAGMALIPAGPFVMGDSLDHDSDALPAHSVTVSVFFMDTKLVTYALWQEVYQWAITNGYAFDNPGMGKATNHPAHTVDWFDAVKWCNARSEMEGITPCYFTSAAQTNIYRTGQINLKNPLVNWSANGYRLPTEAEWEKAARGGASGHRFTWTDAETINRSRGNYYADPTTYAYDNSVTVGNDPDFNDGVEPYTSPVGYFAPNGYGLYDMTGNLYEWCWDWYGSFSAAAQTDPHGPPAGSDRMARGGTWCCDINFSANGCRVAYRSGHGLADSSGYGLGFRCVRSAAP